MTIHNLPDLPLTAEDYKGVPFDYTEDLMDVAEDLLNIISTMKGEDDE